jgi:hypothetical protein
MIELHINGADLMLNGQFDAWQSRLTMGPDLDRLGVQLAVDATSVGSGLTADQPGDHLFSFHSHHVVPVAAGVYRATGRFSGADADASRDMEMQVETSTEHTPTFVISFATRKAELGARWTRLIDSETAPDPSNDDGPVRPAQAWLRAPELAAA